MKLFRRVCCLTLAALLLLPARALAAQTYPDLPPDHWAYSDMDEAVVMCLL